MSYANGIFSSNGEHSSQLANKVDPAEGGVIECT